MKIASETIGQIAKRLAEPGIPVKFMETQLHNLVAANLVHSFGERRGDGPGAWRVYPPEQWAAAKILGVLIDFGFADREVLSACSTRLNTWSVHELPVDESRRDERSPIQIAIGDYFAQRDAGGDYLWTFDVTLFRHSQTGERLVRAALTNHAGNWTTGPGIADENAFIPRATVAIDLKPHFDRIFLDRAGLN